MSLRSFLSMKPSLFWSMIVKACGEGGWSAGVRAARVGSGEGGRWGQEAYLKGGGASGNFREDNIE